ncbi:MAG TPA: LacI family DNA-binding transcriptional regulator [Chthoniobacterales bacterium]|nr:LacI family DNA-binding transcriptional regulator [Chthoniobacterales bacterium]
MTTRVTIKDIAAAADLSISCTARALKGSKDISEKTRQRVKKIAEEMGYYPDPMLRALAAYRQTNKPSDFRGTIAFLNTRFTEAEALADPDVGDLLRGARAKGESLGFQVDYFNISKTKALQLRAWKIIQSRGIEAAILRSFPLNIEDLHIPLQEMRCVALFGAPRASNLPTVSSDHTGAMQNVLTKLAERGYRRPALVLNENTSRFLRHGWRAYFSVDTGDFEKKEVYSYQQGEEEPRQLIRWIEEKNIDVVIFCANYMIEPYLVEKMTSFEQVGMVCMDILKPEEEGSSGIYQNRLQAGAMAVEQMDELLSKPEMELANAPVIHLVPGIWVEGKTLPSR